MSVILPESVALRSREETEAIRAQIFDDVVRSAVRLVEIPFYAPDEATIVGAMLGAMRNERMRAEFVEELRKAQERISRPAVAALPTRRRKPGNGRRRGRKGR